MKKLSINMLIAAIAAVLFTACSHDDNVSEPTEQLQFSFSLSDESSSNGRTQEQLPPGSKLFLSLEKSNGETVFTMKEVKILTFGESYISEPVELRPGHYAITDFLIANEAGEIIYATPKKGSLLASVVRPALPYNIFVGKNRVTTTDMKVADVQGQQPENFGYASFNIHAGTTFQISVLRHADGEMKLTDATGYITEGDDTLHVYNLGAKVNTVFFEGDEGTTYKLTIEKSGYRTFTKEFEINELQEELDGTPLKVILEEQQQTHELVKRMMLKDRNYLFYYNNENQLDSIVVEGGQNLRYVYSVAYTNGMIDSVSTIDNGELVSTHDDIQFDSEGRIVAYKYFFKVPGSEGEFVQYHVTYDSDGNIVSINDTNYVYDDNNDLIQGFGATFTPDDTPNPLHQIQNLFAIVVEETFMWEYIFSKNNTATKSIGGEIFYYGNVFEHDRLLFTEILNSQGQTVDIINFYYEN
jgi:hypothetical protein